MGLEITISRDTDRHLIYKAAAEVSGVKLVTYGKSPKAVVFDLIEAAAGINAHSRGELAQALGPLQARALSASGDDDFAADLDRDSPLPPFEEIRRANAARSQDAGDVVAGLTPRSGRPANLEDLPF